MFTHCCPGRPQLRPIPYPRSRRNSVLDTIRSGYFGTGRATTGRKLRLVSWNIERGLQLPAVVTFLKQQAPDICFLQEVDLNARRTGRAALPAVIARELGLNYIYGIEWEELSQRVGPEPAYQGQAILSWGTFSATRVIRFSAQSDHWRSRWYLPNWQIFQARSGGRMALASELTLGQARLAVYNLHLESRGSDQLRNSQLMEVVQDSWRYPDDTTVLVAGDLNTRRSPSPLRTTLLSSGFQDACENGDSRGTKPNGERLDWIFGRGPALFVEARVHRDTTASDHYPLTASLVLPEHTPITGDGR
ncbi:MAG: endonuclease/exonuclease/phosphatase family protein [Bryobacteraceae bacterium]|nr:endonuclease/exonuclease/phosphatase family protein [Bryobacteraceae bacterium]